MATNGKVKESMFLHSEAKVEFYKKYLELYLRVLYLSKVIDEIFLCDVFCGTGIYENGKKGSPIVAYEEISKLVKEFSGNDTKISLLINDKDSTKTGKVNSYINSKKNTNIEAVFKLYTRNYDVDELFPRLIEFFEGQKRSSRNLLFIDPYGYKNIKRTILEGLLQNGRTEIIMFLPISQMQRFTKKAVESNELMYSHLKEFVFSFFPEDHEIRKKTIPPLLYIDYIKEALRLGEYYTTSYYLERDSKNYYALFFLSKNIYGFEKILEVKWSLDKLQGRGYNLPKPKDLFNDFFEAEQYQENSNKLKALLINYLKQGTKNNVKLYSFILKNEFLPTHLSRLLNDLIKRGIVEVRVNQEVVKKVKIDIFSYANYRNNIDICNVKLIQ